MLEGIGLDWFISLFTLTALEIVLGIDNIVLISILADRLPPEDRSKARRLGLFFALASRLVLLSTVSWLVQMTQPLFELGERAFSLRDLVLLLGGLFLLYKATAEIFAAVENKEHEESHGKGAATLKSMLWQIIFFDMIFSLDSVLTAVGLAKQLSVMIIAVILSMAVMIVFADRIGNFISKNPSMKILALSFLVMIGVLLVAEGFGSHFNKSYVYFAMAFSLVIELLKLRQVKSSAKSKA